MGELTQIESVMAKAKDKAFFKKIEIDKLILK